MKKMLLTFAALSAVSVQTVFAQSRVVTGKVNDDMGPLPGASVVVKGTTTGTVTDNDGNFSINVPDGSTVLVISSIGMDTKEVSIDGKDAIDISLGVDKSQELGPVEVYGKKIDKRSYTGALNTVSSEDIARRPVTSVSAALDGAAPGVLVTSGGGQPGSAPDIMLRGQGSLSASSAPLIVLDGAPYSGSFTSINPLDIKDIVVLKDATAKAVYGARAANGVILITTKRGEISEKPRITVDASVGALDRFIKGYDRLGPKEYYEMAWIGFKNYVAEGGQEPLTSEAFVTFLGGYNAYNVPNAELMEIDGDGNAKVNPNAQLVYTDNWEKELSRIGIRQNYNVGVANGSEKSDYYLSFGYTRDQGIVKNSDYHRITALLNVNSQVTNWLKTGYKIQAAYEDQLFFLGSGTAYSNPFFAAMTMGPIYPVYRYDSTGTRMYNADGSPVYDFGDNPTNTWGGSTQKRPFGENTNSVAALTYNKPNTIALTGNGTVYLEAKFLKDFTAKTTFAINYYNGNQLSYYNSIYGDAANVNGRSIRNNGTHYNYTFNQFLTWLPTFSSLNSDSGNHNFQLTVGHEAYNMKNSYLYMRRTGFFAPYFTEGDAAAVGEGSGSSIDQLRIETYFAQAEYNFKRKYYLSGSYSRNGSSRFSQRSRWGDFGSVGVGWVMSDEEFLKSVTWLDFLKLRASYGVTGNDAINGYYSYLDRFTSYPNANNPGLIFANWGNDDLKWEGMVDMNVGIDFETLKRRFNGSIDVYSRGANNLLFVQPVAPSTGSSGYYANVGAMRNRGIEATLSYDVLRGKNLKWTTRVNLAHNRNAIISVQGDDSLIGGGTILAKGLPANAWYMAEYAGVNSQGEAMWYTHDSATGERITTTEYASLDPYRDYKYFGATNRDLDGSWTNTVRYKNFDISFQFNFGLGGKYYDGNYAGLVGNGISVLGNAMHVDMLNSWQQPGDENNPDVLPRFSYGPSGDLTGGISNRFLISNSFLTLKNINLGYSFGPKILGNSGFSSARIYFAMDNVFQLAARKGVDINSGFFGVSSFTYFPYRTAVLGVNFSL